MSTETQDHGEMDETPEEPVMDEPTKTVSYTVKGEEYLEFQWINDRIIFPGKLPARQRDREIIKLALSCLKEKMEQEQEKTGSSFVKATAIIGENG